MSASSIDPAAIPQRRLASGATMPGIGLGTFGSDNYSADDIGVAVRGAIEIGYRHIDCASVYGNEREVGAAIAASGVPRDGLWVTSKLWNDAHDDVAASCRASLEALGLDRLDLYLVHWPFPNHHPPGCDITSRSPDSVPYAHERFMRTWRAMETLVDDGLVRHIGTSNMTISKLDGVLADARVKPAVNQMELHPHFQQSELFEFSRANDILPVGYCPIGSPGRPARDRTPDDTSPIEDPVIVEIANTRGVHPAVVCVSWAVTRGHVPIPFSVKRSQYEANLAAAAEPLSQDEMNAIAACDRGCRLIKGDVFLWEDANGWEDLWQ